MQAEEQGSVENFLRFNDCDPRAFTQADFVAHTAGYARIGVLEAAISSARKGKARNKAKEKVKAAYDRLLRDVRRTVLAAGHPEFDAAVTLAAQQHQALTPEDEPRPNRNPVYQMVAAATWPDLKARGSMPDSFWKAVKTKAKTQFAAAAPAGGTYSETCTQVAADMQKQFKQWDGTDTNRGAWWGSPKPGDKTGAQDVPSSVVVELQSKVSGAWQFKNSFSGETSFHRAQGGVDFIYHMKPPVE